MTAPGPLSSSWVSRPPAAGARRPRPGPLRGRSIGALLAVPLALALGPIGGCGSGQRPDLAVTAFSPTRAAAEARAIEVSFDQPVIEDGQIGAALDAGSVALTPAVPWTGRWRDRYTLVIEPTEPLAPSTRYQVALTGELGRRTGGFRFEFVHQPLEVEGVAGADPQALPVEGSWRLGFNQPVAGKAVAAGCALVGARGTVALEAVAPDEVATDAGVRPASPLAPDATYTLRCARVTPARGDAPLPEPWSLEVKTRSNLFVKRVTPGGWDVAADEVNVEVVFSTPVTLEAARQAVTSTPRIPGLDQGWLDGGGTRYRVTADLEVETEYRLKVADLADSFGQRLTAPHEHTFRTGDARPRISMERGIYALEASARGYPIWTRNVKRYDLECGAVPRDRLVQVLTTDMNYDPWGGSDDTRPIDWKKLGVTTRTRPMTVAGARNKWHLDDVDLGATCGGRSGARGVYLADVRSAEIVPDPKEPWRTRATHRVLANLTDLGVLVQAGPASGLVWVTSLSTGKPVAGARVTVYTPQGKAVHTGTSDGAGLVRTPGTATLLEQPPARDHAALEDEGEGWDEWDSYRAQRLIAVVEHGADLAVVDGNWANGIQIWNFGVPEDRSGGKTMLRAFIQSDRGLYRPGERVHFKGLVRELAAGHGPRVPATPGPVAVEVTDSRGQSLHTATLTTSAFGGFAFDLPLGPDAALGDYHVVARIGGQHFRERFLVEEFRPASFEVAIEAGEDLVRPGDRLAARVSARYLFGAPVAGAEVEWSVARRPHQLRFKGYEQYSFDAERRWWWYGDDDGGGYTDLVSDGAGRTDADGGFAFAVRDPDSKFAGPRDYILSATVTDQAAQAMRKATVVTAHQSEFYLGVHTQEWVQAVGMPFAVNVVAVDPRGKRVAQQATLSFVRRVRDCRWDDHGFRSYASCTTHEDVALQRAITIPATGTATERLYPKEPGDYLVRVETTDARGARVVAASDLWVIGKGEAFWSGDESARMTLVASKASYRAGDTARLVAQTGLRTPTALVTVERDGILSARVQPMASAAEGIELAVQDAWAPNVYARVTMVSGRHGPTDRDRPQLKMGLVELKVSAEHRRLAVAVATDRATYRPGETVTGTLTVTHDGKPVAAEVAVSVADEGVLQLIDYQTPDPMATFYRSFGLGVDAGTNWNRVARLADPAAGDPDEGGDGGGGEDPERVRSRFVASAYWAPALVTDARGQVRFSFAAPDNLTAFRVMAVAADAGERFGKGDLRFTVAKPLLAQPALPRFLTVGDQQSVGVVVHNRTGAAGTATVTAAATGATLAETARTVHLPAGGSARVRFPATSGAGPDARFEFAVSLGGERDRVQVDLPINRPRVRAARLAGRGKLDARTPAAIAVTPAAGTIAAESELAITVDRTGLGDLEPSLKYLVEYPYGCLEQTLSRFIPLAKAKDLATSMKLASLAGTRADAFLAAGVAKVIRHQQGDGHFSLWPQSETYPHLTVYALFGLREAEKAGVAVPRDAVTRGHAAVGRWLASPDAWKPEQLGMTAMAAFLLARDAKADHGVIARLFDQRAALPTWGQAFLARAMKLARSDARQQREVLRLITAAAQVTGDAAVIVDDARDPSLHMGSNVRATAMTLAALLEVAPRDPLIEPLLRGLDGARDLGGRWGSTQDNLWALIAFADYARRASAGTSTVTFTSGGRTLGTETVSGGAAAVVRVPLTAVGPGGVELSATGPVHYRARLTEVSLDGGQATAAGFTVSREYLDAAGRPATRFAAGALVTVRLTVSTPAARRWVAMVDPLPAGLEPVNPRLKTAAGGGGGGGGVRSWMWDHQELRDDEVRWFADHIWSGTMVMTYQARATVDGTFHAGPARIEAMYEPTVHGRSAAASITVTP